MTTTYNDVHVLVTGIALPVCCRAQHLSRTSTLPTTFPLSQLLPAQILRVNSRVGLSYIVWKCTSHSTFSKSSEASTQSNTCHSQWILQHHVSIVQRASPNANAALGRGPHDSKFEDENPRVELWSSKCGPMGRFTVAKQTIYKGERAFQATAFAIIVRQSLAPRRCHWCFVTLRKKALQCGDCEFSRYCSRDCLAADATLHAFQCQALRALKRRDIGTFDVETVRLALAVLSMEQFVQNPQVLGLLAVHRRQDSNEEKKMHTAVDFIVEMTGRTLGPRRVKATLERVRCNAHPLYLDGMTCVGTGIFPEAAMALNHSCLPNVVPSFDPRTRTLAFHAITEIPKGGAVEYAYIDLLQTRKRRQMLLSQGFGFNCVCERCTSELKNPTEDEDEVEETRVMEQLIQIMNSRRSDTKQQLVHLKKEHEGVFKGSNEAAFALYTAEMQFARAQNDWGHVVKAAETLLEIWSRCGLPKYYHTAETLHLQIYSAAKQAGMVEKSKVSAKQVAHIRQICGYSHPETLLE